MKLATTCCLFASSLAIARAAPAEELVWKDEWPRFRIGEWIVTGVAGAGLLALYSLEPPPPTWGRPIAFDAPVRDALQADPGPVRETWADASTYGYYAMMAYPVLVDALVVPLARGSRTVAAQTGLIDLQAFAVSGLVFRLTERAVRRARPFVWECQERTGDYRACHERGDGLVNTNSFIAGHATIAATGAALTCTHHAYVKLYGGPWDAVACGLGIAVATGVGVGRIVSDRHYATDVLTGMVVGALSGWLMPTLLHYGFDGKGSKTSTALEWIPLPTSDGTALGAGWSRWF